MMKCMDMGLRLGSEELYRARLIMPFKAGSHNYAITFYVDSFAVLELSTGLVASERLRATSKAHLRKWIAAQIEELTRIDDRIGSLVRHALKDERAAIVSIDDVPAKPKKRDDAVKAYNALPARDKTPKTPKPKRVRRVFPTYQLAHKWVYANTVGPDWARNPQDNLRYNGASITSYSTTIGIRLELPNGEHMFVLSGRTYSNVTARHLSDIYHAIPAERRVKMPEDVAIASGYYHKPETPITHWHDVIVSFERYIIGRLETMLKAGWLESWKTRPVAFWEYERANVEYRRVCGLTGVTPKNWQTVYPSLADLETQIRDRRARYLPSYTRTSRYERRVAMDSRTIEERLIAFLNGSYVSWPSYIYGHVVRKNDRDEVVTTGGVTMPVSIVKRVWNSAIRLGNAPPSHIGPYECYSIGEFYSRIGCHEFYVMGMASLALAAGIPLTDELKSRLADAGSIGHSLAAHYGVTL